jgi:hypothetical protein
MARTHTYAVQQGFFGRPSHLTCHLSCGPRATVAPSQRLCHRGGAYRASVCEGGGFYMPLRAIDLPFTWLREWMGYCSAVSGATASPGGAQPSLYGHGTEASDLYPVRKTTWIARRNLGSGTPPRRGDFHGITVALVYSAQHTKRNGAEARVGYKVSERFRFVLSTTNGQENPFSGGQKTKN